MGKDLKLQCRYKILQVFVLLILSLVICAPLVINNTVYADTITAKVSSLDQTIHRGQTFDVDVSVKENTGILTMFLTIKFDHDIFKLTNVMQIRDALGELNMEHSGSGYDYIDEKTGGFNLFWDGSRADATNGTIVKLTFQSSITAPIGTYPIDIVVDEENTTIAYNVQANVQATSPQINLIEGAYIVVWHDWDGNAVDNSNITGHPYNQMTGGYEYSSEDSLNVKTDFPNNPTRQEDDMYTYQFSGWEGAVWRGDVPNDSYVIYYVAKYISTPKVYPVFYFVDGYIDGEKIVVNLPDGEIDEEKERFAAKSAGYGSIIDDRVLPYRKDYTFYGWYTDLKFKHRLDTPLMPAKELKLYGYFKYNIRETDIPIIQLVYRETITNAEMENIAYVDVNITKNFGLSSLKIALSSFDTTNFTFCGFQKGEIFKQMSFSTTNYENDVYPENFNFMWDNYSINSYEIGNLLVLKFKVNSNSSPGAYEVVMTADNQNTTYISNGEIWYSDIEFLNTKIPIGKTNHWIVPIKSTETVIEVESQREVPYNIELVARVLTENAEIIIDNDSLREVLADNMMVHNLFEIYFEQNATRLTPEQYTYYFGSENVVVKIKLTSLQVGCKKLDIYYIDDKGKMNLYDSNVENGYLVFQTNHFSNWALIGDTLVTNIETSSIKLLRVSLILFGISASALISIAFVRNRKKQSLIVYKNNKKGGTEN